MTSRAPSRRGIRGAVGILVLGAAALGLTACGHSPSTAAGTTATGSASASAGPVAGDAGQSAGTTASGGSTKGGTGSGGGGNGSTPSAHPSSGAQIVYFKTTQQPMCPIVGTSAAPFSSPGQDVVISWKVTGATGVAISIDSPDFFKQYGSGSYGSYGATGSLSLAFPCGDVTHQTTSHTYTLNTLGTGTSKAMTITVSARNQP